MGVHQSVHDGEPEARAGGARVVKNGSVALLRTKVSMPSPVSRMATATAGASSSVVP